MAQRGGKREGSGRKKGLATIAAEKARAIIAVRLEKELEPILTKAIELAKLGDKSARDWLTDQGWGKPMQSSEIDITTDGDKLTINDNQYKQLIRTANKRVNSPKSIK